MVASMSRILFDSLKLGVGMRSDEHMGSPSLLAIMAMGCVVGDVALGGGWPWRGGFGSQGGS